MRVIGIDLAAQPRKTAACVLDGLDATIALGCDDEGLIALADGAEKVAIDAPFGWPRPFVEALVAHRSHEASPAPDDGTPDEYRRALSYRETDRAVMRIRRPLSVSTDKLGVTAMRCAHLLQRWSLQETVDRSGVTGRFVEVYPAAAMTCWNITPGPYKGTNGAKAREAVLRDLLDRVPVVVDTTVVLASDDALDALVAALVARAVVLGLADGPPDDRRDLAVEEGWIHLPHVGSLSRMSE